MRVVIFSSYVRIANRRVTFERKVDPLPLDTLSAFYVHFRHIATHCAHSLHFLLVNVGLSKPFLPATETTPRLGHPVSNLAHILLRVNSALSGGMNVPQSNTSNRRQPWWTSTSPPKGSWYCGRHGAGGELRV